MSPRKHKQTAHESEPFVYLEIDRLALDFSREALFFAITPVFAALSNVL